ncbi:large subunit ribosomal protein L23 [Natronocella acetinitrilica]|uniref:Large ribosomal subunit protein uL23 n=1 Tax=Natronocella acetinitrilica TaxID=414046 RepID=A0AAE3KC70_9GAMM|nr:50S ribosomal protein L23 [Natronocella acetinitrilica]MCP1676550.1 large subunit ribosomal protein L23 [Natronocella acetinitrilica]
MSQERIFKVLLAPHVSEKTERSADGANQVVFRVVKDASKQEIKRAVEELFDVKVRNVQTVLMKGKSKGFGRIRGRRSDWKKAYVALEAGQEIDFLGGE